VSGEVESSCPNLKIPPQMNVVIFAIFHPTSNLSVKERPEVFKRADAREQQLCCELSDLSRVKMGE
jgi:hypothetical protein